MKLYLSSYRIPVPDDLSKLIGKPLSEVKIALIPNAKDYYIKRVKDLAGVDMIQYMQQLGMHAEVVDLQDYNQADDLKSKLSSYDLIWVRGGNTYMLRYQMKRSGFDVIIRNVLDSGVVYGGDSAGALAAGISIAGVELADDPRFAEELVNDGLDLVPVVILPHVDNPEFAEVLPVFRELHKDKEIIELKDSQAIVFDGRSRHLVSATDVVQ